MNEIFSDPYLTARLMQSIALHLVFGLITGLIYRI